MPALDAMAMRSILPHYRHRSTRALMSGVKVSSPTRDPLLPILNSLVVKREYIFVANRDRGEYRNMRQKPKYIRTLTSQSEILEHL